MSSITSLFEINGIVNTDKNVLDNLNELCTASGCWLTYDIGQGKWAVVINRVDTAVADFDDSNIIGSINITGTGIYELYNKVSVEFPHKDLYDATDYVELTIPSGDRFPNELDNTLNIKLDIVNDPIQAQNIGGRELKQSRVDKVIEFRTDFTYIGLKAGDLVSVTSAMYSYTNKLFRIISIEEDDSEEFIISIKALEYDADVYDISDLAGGLVRTERGKRTGIVAKTQNPAIQASDDISTGEQLSRLLIANGAASLLGSLFKRILGTNTFGPSEQGQTLDKLLRGLKKPDVVSVSLPSSICEGGTISIGVSCACDSTCFLDIPDFEYPYSITGVFPEDIESMTINGQSVPVSLEGNIIVSGGTSTMLIDTTATAGGSSSETFSITVGGVNNSCIIYNVLTQTYNTVSNVGSITEGGSVTFTVNTVDVANGTTIPYSITGTASGKVTSPSLTGNITINSNTASVVVATNDDSTYTGTQSLTFGISPTFPAGNPCHGTRDLTASVTVLDNESPPVEPPPPPPDQTRQYVSTPVVWAGTYDGTTGQLKSISVLRSAFMPVPFAGEPTVNVPLTLSVSQGNPSSITVTSTRSISTVSTLGGTLLEPIITFNTVAPNAAITGTRSNIFGYF
jgi:hypothetical protein